MARRAFITGIGGQDGSFLAELLIAEKHEVLGFHHLVQMLVDAGLARLGGASPASKKPRTEAL